jgi:hypothetical protein
MERSKVAVGGIGDSICSWMKNPKPVSLFDREITMTFRKHDYWRCKKELATGNLFYRKRL